MLGDVSKVLWVLRCVLARVNPQCLTVRAYLPEKKNRAGEIIYRAKAILGLASPNESLEVHEEISEL